MARCVLRRPWIKLFIMSTSGLEDWLSDALRENEQNCHGLDVKPVACKGFRQSLSIILPC